MNKTKKQTPNTIPAKLDSKDLKEVNGGTGNYYAKFTHWNTVPGGIALN
ncbi:MAG: hypothetical protein GY811_10070 [Myxococcales bacterium]|nr:hypothetical protein [Myxococcales bacterium]